MRIGLLSTIELADDDRESRVSGLVLAGLSIAHRQLDLILALGCERVICIAQGVGQDLLALQHQAEAAGARFNAISDSQALLGLVNVTDEVVVVAEGLLPDTAEAQRALAEEGRVLALPVEAGIAAGFQRIDLNHAWAGVLVMPGRLVERLSQLPPDCDTVAALLRIALQGQVPQRVLPEALLAERRWAIIGNLREIGEIEPIWVRRHLPAPNLFVPGRSIAGFAVRLLGLPLFDRGLRPEMLGWLGAGIAAFGVVFAYWQWPVTGLMLLAVAWLFSEACKAFGQVVRAGLGHSHFGGRAEWLVAWLIDLSLAAILLFALPGGWTDRIFTVVVLLGSASLAGQLIGRKWAELAQDRLLLAAALALGAGFGLLLPAIQAICIVLMAVLVRFAHDRTQLTQT